MGLSTIQIILLVIFGCIAGMGSVLDSFQTHRPLIACTIVGAILGDLQTGIILGGTLEMIALGWMNIGAAQSPDSALASIISTILVIVGKQSISAGIAIALPVAVAGQVLTVFARTVTIFFQHAAHERVLYERILKGMKTREYTSQYISPPIILDLSMQEAELFRRYMDRFTRIGFEIEPFGGDSFAVRAVPDNLFSVAKKELLMEMIDSLSDEVSTNMTPEILDEKIASMSCKAAVKGNSRLSRAEVEELLKELLKLDNPYHCPHGRPTIIAMTKRELEKKFKRII